MTHLKRKLMMTLALLVTAATGAWAQNTYTVQFSANNKTVTMKNVTLPHKFSCNRANNGSGNGNGELDQIIQNIYDCSYGWCSSAAAPTASGKSNVTASMEGDYHVIDISAPFEGTATVTGSYVNYNANEIITYSLEISISSAIIVSITSGDLEYVETPYTKEGVTMTGGVGQSLYGPVTFSTDLGNFTKIVMTSNNYSDISGDGWTTVNDEVSTWTGNASSVSFNGDIYAWVTIECTIEPAASGTPVAITWDATTKTATLTNGMPAGNVTVSVEYFPQATAEGAVTAATGVKATTEDALVTIDENKLTGVAKMMYYVSADAEATAPAYDAEGWTDKVPTAENYTQAADLKVWYYPVGADEGVGEATATYSDGDMNATALAVSLGDAPLWNAEFDLTDAPEEDKAPGVWSTDITGDGVIKGTNVTVTYTGTRKVIGVKAEKKSSAPTLKDALADGATVVINYTWFGTNVTTFTYTNNAGTFTGNATGIEAEYFDNGMSMDGTTLKFTASNKDMSDANVSIDFNTDTNGYVANKGSAFTSFTISVNGTEISVSEVVVEVVDETGD